MKKIEVSMTQKQIDDFLYNFPKTMTVLEDIINSEDILNNIKYNLFVLENRIETMSVEEYNKTVHKFKNELKNECKLYLIKYIFEVYVLEVYTKFNVLKDEDLQRRLSFESVNEILDELIDNLKKKIEDWS